MSCKAPGDYHDKFDRKANTMENIPFIHLFQTDRSNYFYDVNSNDIVRVNDIVCQVLRLLSSGLNNEHIVSAFGEFPKDQVEDAVRLVEQHRLEGHVLSSNRPEQIEYFSCDHMIEYLYESFIEQLTLEVTERCNQRCRYCTHSGMYPNHRPHGPRDMDWSTARAAIDFILKHGGAEANPYLDRPEDTRDFSLGFYGGEPLLRFDLIERCIRYTRERLGEQRECHFTLSTNGTLFSPDMIKFFLDNNVCISVSLDGPVAVHDRMRVFPDGSGTHAKVIKAIESIQTYAATLNRAIPYHGLINMVVSGDVDYVDLWDYLTSLVSCPRNTFAKSFDLRKNRICGCCPYKRMTF